MSVRSSVGEMVQGTFAYDASTFTATFTPSRSLAEFTTYTATIANDVRDLAGLQLEAPAQWSFTTVDNTRPRVYSVNPPMGNNNIQLNARATVRFTESMDPATINTTTFYVFNRDAKANVAGTITLDNYDGATFTPSAPLCPGTRYTVTVTTDARDRAGNGLASPGFTSDFFTTSKPDTTSPYVLKSEPADGESGARINGVVTVTFSEQVDEATVTPATYSLRNSVTGELVESSVRRDGYAVQEYILTPRFELAKNTRYTVTLTTGIRDYAGNSMAENRSFSFTTAP